MRMEDPVVSIYDMLMKRYRQQRRDDQQQQKEAPPHRQASRDLRQPYAALQQPQAGVQLSADKKPRPRLARPRLAGDSLTGGKMSTNVVTATHLTKKQSGVLLQPPLKKEVLNQLVAKMSGKQTPAAAAIAAATAAPEKPSTSLNKKRSKTGKGLKSSHGSESSNRRSRPVLSPRNTNRQLKSQSKRDKSKINNELKQQQQQQQTPPPPPQQRRPKNPESERQKVRLRSRLSKFSVTANDQSADNAVRCRL
ncbi:PREDICTED: probable serine/threonine-protein kinase DDB_G0281745 [Drosophila arizonae]|uniref:Probable serine/threonine-protein kinase DDB_G0281745 n=1 Tax=Drosophila arizonae TaxID=7263 RepID=A0ABM1NQ24_DROAR|nr:PREDICTED: probable serine/threonine-protein kinase DDB_G0281745 [Drosophila arizonae]